LKNAVKNIARFWINACKTEAGNYQKWGRNSKPKDNSNTIATYSKHMSSLTAEYQRYGMLALTQVAAVLRTTGLQND